MRGVSARQRAHTILEAVKANAKPSDIKQPGHIFPLVAKPGGVLKRAGHTEAGVDLARMAGCEPAAVLAYAELYFPEVHFPDFNESEYDKALMEFNKRNRRFGNAK